MIKLDYIELLQLSLILDMTKKKMFMGGDMRRPASLTRKVNDEIAKIKLNK